MAHEDHSRGTTSLTFEALAHELRCRCEAACRFSGSHTYYREELLIFREVAEEDGLFREDFPIGSRPL